MKHSILTAILLGTACVLVKVEAYSNIALQACKTNDTDPEDEFQLDNEELFYVDFENKEVISTVPEFIGKVNAPGWAQQAMANHQICISNVKTVAKGEGYPPDEIDAPQATIYPKEFVELGKSNRLICFVNNFFPPPVKVKWTKNNVEVQDGVTLSRYYPNPDFTFQQFSTLSITPEKGDIYSCSVAHAGLPNPLTRIWEPEANNESDTAATAFCGIGLTLGLLGVGVGTFFLIKGNNCN